jgi:hypothetical protein
VELKILKLRLRTYSRPFFGDAIEAFFWRGNIGDFGLCVNGKITLAAFTFKETKNGAYKSQVWRKLILVRERGFGNTAEKVFQI